MTLRLSTLALFVGDIFFFILALWLALFLRALEVPPQGTFEAHIAAFIPLFLIWVVVFLIAGLYEWRQFLLARRVLSSTLLSAQTANVLIAALFFFLVPLFGITPKTVLLIYLGVSFALILLWRAVIFPYLGLQKPERALFVGEGKEMDDLMATLGPSRLAPIIIAAHITPRSDLTQNTIDAIRTYRPEIIVADFNNKEVAAGLPTIYKLLATGVRFIDMGRLYEEVFGRIPLSRLDDRWIAENISRTVHRLYDPLKRLMDIVAGIVLGVLSLIFYPFILVAILLDDGLPFFISQERVGEGERSVRLFKFRSMSGNDRGQYGSEGKSELTVTPVGKILRVLRLDELPQLWNILKGDLSLIGPRPEFFSLVATYEKEIPYYGVRHLIKPGLSGWAQLYHDNHPHHGAAVEATREKLSYDLYYLKHRSLTLDAIIALKTIKKMLTKSGI